jgi:hypothetical protein
MWKNTHTIPSFFMWFFLFWLYWRNLKQDNCDKDTAQLQQRCGGISRVLSTNNDHLMNVMWEKCGNEWRSAVTKLCILWGYSVCDRRRCVHSRQHSTHPFKLTTLHPTTYYYYSILCVPAHDLLCALPVFRPRTPSVMSGHRGSCHRGSIDEWDRVTQWKE